MEESLEGSLVVGRWSVGGFLRCSLFNITVVVYAFSIIPWRSKRKESSFFRAQYHVAVVSLVCIRPCLSVPSISVNVIWYHYTKLSAGYIDLSKDLNQHKSYSFKSNIMISGENCEAKESLCFAQRIEKIKTKKSKTNPFTWMSSWTSSHSGANTFQTSSECIYDVCMSLSCTIYYVSIVFLYY